MNEANSFRVVMVFFSAERRGSWTGEAHCRANASVARLSGSMIRLVRCEGGFDMASRVRHRRPTRSSSRPNGKKPISASRDNKGNRIQSGIDSFPLLAGGNHRRKDDRSEAAITTKHPRKPQRPSEHFPRTRLPPVRRVPGIIDA